MNDEEILQGGIKMIPNHEWIEVEEFIEIYEEYTTCFVNIEGVIFRGHLSVNKYGSVGFRVYRYYKHADMLIFFDHTNPYIYGVMLDDGKYELETLQEA